MRPTGVSPMCPTGVSPVDAGGRREEEETAHGQDARATHGQDAHATQLDADAGDLAIEAGFFPTTWSQGAGAPPSGKESA